MADVDWGDEDDSYLGEIDWDAQEAQIRAKRSHTSGAQLASHHPAPHPAHQQFNAGHGGPPPGANYQNYLAGGPAPAYHPPAWPQQQHQAPGGVPLPQQQQQPCYPAVNGGHAQHGYSGPPQPWQQQQGYQGAPPPGGYAAAAPGPPPAAVYAPPPQYNNPQQQYNLQYATTNQCNPNDYQQQQQQYNNGGNGNNAYQEQQHQQQGGPPPLAAPRPPQPPQSAPAPLPPAVVTLFASLQLPRSAGAAKKNPAALAAGLAPTTAEPMLEVRMGWHDAAAAALRGVGGGSWDPRSRAWLFPLSSHDKVVAALKAVSGVRINVDPLHPLPAAVLSAAAKIPDDTSRYCHIPTSLETQLMAFQREGVKFGLRHGGRCLIGDEMGLGKTVQAIALAAAYRDEWPGLVVAPSSLREQWADALHKWLGVTEDRVHIVHNGKDAAAVPKAGLDFLIVSYNFLDKMDLAGKYNLIIVDESHYIKDSTAKRTKAALPVLKGAKRCLLLTGTPALNRPKEIFTQLSALVPEAKIKMKDFGERYCAGNRFDRYGGSQNLDELHSMLRGSVMVRRLKADVLSQLPKKRRQQVFLSLDSDARRELAALQKQLEGAKAVMAQLAALNAATGGAMAAGGNRMEENRAIMEMYRRTAELKTKAVQDYVDMLLDGGQKFLVFAHHAVLMDAIEHVCNRRKGCRFIRIDGKTPASDRSRLVASFQDDDTVRVAILSIRAAGVGLTLTAASTVVFAEMTWTPGEMIQAEDRAHRIGQASAVNVYFLHVRNSVDEVIWNAIQNKLENVGQALDGTNNAMEVGAARTMPERGQKALDTYLTQQPFPAAAALPLQAAAAVVPPLQHQQRPPLPGDPKQQASLRNFFPQVAGQENDAGGAAAKAGEKRSRDSACIDLT